MRDSDAWYERCKRGMQTSGKRLAPRPWQDSERYGLARFLTCDLTVSSFHEFLMCMRELAARRRYMDVALERNNVSDAAVRAALARAITSRQELT